MAENTETTQTELSEDEIVQKMKALSTDDIVQKMKEVKLPQQEPSISRKIAETPIALPTLEPADIVKKAAEFGIFLPPAAMLKLRQGKVGEVTRQIPQLLHVLGSGAGAVAGTSAGGLGAIAGGFAGGQIALEAGNLMRAADPELFGRPMTSEELLEEAFLDNLINIGTVGVGKLPGARKAAEQKLFDIIKNHSGKFSKATKRSLQWLKDNGLDIEKYGFKFTSGAKGGAADVLEDLLAPSMKKQITLENNRAFARTLEDATGLKIKVPTDDTDYFKMFRTTTETGRVGQKVATRHFNAAALAERSAYQKVEDVLPTREFVLPKTVATNVLDAQGNPVKRTVNQVVELKGPVALGNTAPVADIHKKDLDKLVEKAEAEAALTGADTSVASYYRQVKDTVDQLLEPATIIGKDGEPKQILAKEFNTLKEMRTQLSKIVWKGANLAKTSNAPTQVNNVKRIALQLQDAITEDVFTTYPKDGPVGKTIANAFEASRRKFITFPPDIEDLMRGDASQFWNKIATNPQQAERLVAAMGGNKTPLQVETLSRFLEKHMVLTEDADLVLNAKAALNDWKGREWEGLTKVAITGRKKKIMDNFLTVAASVDQQMQKTGQTALGIRAAGAGATVTSGLVKNVISANAAGVLSSLFSAPSALLFLTFNLKDFTERVLLDPTMGKVATGLLKAPPKSTQAVQGMRKILKAMKGTQAFISVINEEGFERPVAEVQLTEQPKGSRGFRFQGETLRTEQNPQQAQE